MEEQPRRDTLGATATGAQVAETLSARVPARLRLPRDLRARLG
jgi:hypothetical protein